MIDETKLDELLTLAEKATPGSWRWQDDYDCGEHLEHRDQGLQADCENVRDSCKRVTLESPEGSVLKHWFEYSSDGGIQIETRDAAFIQSCSPEIIRSLVEEVRESRHLLKLCHENPRAEDEERMAYLDLFVAEMRERAVSTPSGECSEEYRAGFDACANWIRHELRVLDELCENIACQEITTRSSSLEI